MSMIGRIDVHSHLLPGIDDGCKTVLESIECARLLVSHGYTHSFCTPHIWPSYPSNTVAQIPIMCAALQAQLDEHHIPLKLIPGGELNLRADLLTTTPPHALVTFAMNRKYALIDFWADKLPPFFEPNMRWMQSLGLTVVLAHPERMRAVQDDPRVVDEIQKLGILLQGNLACFSDPPDAHNRRAAERLLSQDRYFMVGSDLHSLESLPSRMAGLKRIAELVGDEKLRQLTFENPSKLLPDEIAANGP
jgi:protein-tyrosine phosphatase